MSTVQQEMPIMYLMSGQHIHQLVSTAFAVKESSCFFWVGQAGRKASGSSSAWSHLLLGELCLLDEF